MATSADQAERAVRLRVAGRVQGVSYRAWAERLAATLGVTGWVRNRPDGTVEMVVQGTSAAVDAWVQQCRTGPPEARVDRLDEESIGVDPGHLKFDVRS